jgi:hypothetical protein
MDEEEYKSQVDLLDSCLPAERREERSKLRLPKQPEAGCNGRPPQSNNAVLPGTSSRIPRLPFKCSACPSPGDRRLAGCWLYRSICHDPAGRPFRLILALDRIPWICPTCTSAIYYIPFDSASGFCSSLSSLYSLLLLSLSLSPPPLTLQILLPLHLYMHPS